MKGLLDELGRGLQAAALLVVAGSLAPWMGQRGGVGVPGSPAVLADLAGASARVAEQAIPAAAVVAPKPDDEPEPPADPQAPPAARRPGPAPRVAIGFDPPRAEREAAPAPEAQPEKPAAEAPGRLAVLLPLPMLPPQVRVGPPPPPLPRPTRRLRVIPPGMPRDVRIAPDPPAPLADRPLDEPPPEHVVEAYWRRDIQRYRMMRQMGYTTAGFRRVFGNRYDLVRPVAQSNFPLDRLPKPTALYARALARSPEFQQKPAPPVPSSLRMLARTAQGANRRSVPPPPAPAPWSSNANSNTNANANSSSRTEPAW